MAGKVNRPLPRVPAASRYLCHEHLHHRHVESSRVVLSAKQKALRVNMNHDLYGTFAEIGAGQEVVRHFFRAGGASGKAAPEKAAPEKAPLNGLWNGAVNGL